MNVPVLAKHSDPKTHVFSHFSLAGKTAIVTGGTRGIGLEIARGLAEAGARVAITYTSTNEETAKVTAAALTTSTGQQVQAFRADVGSPSEIKSAVRSITDGFFGGRLDIVVANAGIASHHAAEDYTPEEFQDIINVNLNGAFYTAQEAGKIFKKQFGVDGKYSGQGKVIFTASVSAILVNIPQKQCAYNASKAAVVHLAKCLAAE